MRTDNPGRAATVRGGAMRVSDREASCGPTNPGRAATVRGVDLREAHSRLDRLRATVREMASRDPEQEVRGMAIPVLDAIINASRGLIPDEDVVARVVRDIIDPDAVATGDLVEVRAIDALLVVDH